MYVELICRSNFSFLRGASDSREFVERAVELRMPGVAITDLNGVYGIPRAYEVARHAADFNLISGAELTLRDHPSLTMLVRDRAAYGVLCRLITASHAGKPKGEASLSLEEILAACQSKVGSGLVVLSDPSERQRLDLLKDVFGDRLYLPLCFYDDGLDSERIEKTLELSKRFGVGLVAHNDVHYHLPTRRRVQDCFTCIREGVNMETAGFKLFPNGERYLKSPLQMRAQFRDLPEAIRATLKIAESCTFKLSELKYTYPKELTPEGHTPQSYFEELVLQGAQVIYRGAIPHAVAEQIEHEARLIQKLDYASYFLTLHDIVRFAKERKIIAQGRGSAANSISCYCLGITAIDPVRMGLLFERFISEERKEPPDIDVDFEHERREEVIQYVYERYGCDHAGMVSAVRTYRGRSAFQEMAKAVGVPVGTRSADALMEDFDEVAGPEHCHKLPVIEELVQEIKGFPRHLSIHSGGFTLSAEPIIETVPIEPARMPGRTVIQWDKNDLDTVGLLKVDLLALGFLTALHKICDMIEMDWREIPPEDPETYAMIQRAETEGTFQIESRAQKAMLPKTRPECFYDLVVQVAIVRPGPNVGEMIHPYLERRQMHRRGKPYVIEDEAIRSALGRTYGVPIFQEQIMKLAIMKAGFSPGEADQLRRAIAAWRDAESVDAMGKRLYSGLLANGVSPAYADELFGYVKGYAHYGFPESHAASFALISYKSAYLKCHYPAEFLCGLLNSQPMGFYPIDTLINDARRKGVVVLPIDPNRSNWDSVMEGKGTIRMGFRNVRSIREEDVKWMSAKNERELRESDIRSPISKEQLLSAVDVLTEERKREPFRDLLDFIRRTRFKKEVIEALALSDAFTCFGLDQRHSFWNSIEYGALLNSESSTQLSLFERESPERAREQVFKPMTLLEQISSDYSNLGYSLKGNFMAGLRREHPGLPPLTASTVRLLQDKIWVRYAGVLTVMQRPPPANGVCFITLEDETGSLDLILWKNIYEEFEEILRSTRFLTVEGRVQKEGDSTSLIVSRVEPMIEDGDFGHKPIRPGEHPRSI